VVSRAKNASNGSNAAEPATPEAFDAQKDPQNLSTRWEDWVTRFKRFTAASGITQETQRHEILLYAGGTHVAETRYAGHTY
jgi:hypothetical protein